MSTIVGQLSQSTHDIVQLSLIDFSFLLHNAGNDRGGGRGIEFEETVSESVLACPTRLRNAMPLYTRGFARLNPTPVSSTDNEAF
jgi:hypothetical protein